MKKTILAIAAVTVASTSAFAVSTAACAGCHGQNFEKKAMNVSKIVKDLSKDDIVKALKGYKDGTFGGAMKGVMQGQVKNLSDEDIEAIAEQIAGGDKKEADATGTATEATDKAAETAGDAVDAAKEKAAETAGDAVDAAKEKAAETAGDAVDAAKEKAADSAENIVK